MPLFKVRVHVDALTASDRYLRRVEHEPAATWLQRARSDIEGKNESQLQF